MLTSPSEVLAALEFVRYFTDLKVVSFRQACTDQKQYPCATQ